MKKTTYEEFNRKLESEDICFINSYESAVIRSVRKENGTDYYVKFKGSKEFKANKGSNIVAEGWREHQLITKEEYDLF